MRWAWIWLRSLLVLHCCRSKVFGFSMVVMAVMGLAGKTVSVESISLSCEFEKKNSQKLDKGQGLE